MKLLILLLLPTLAFGQGFTVTGGDSTLLGAAGAEVKASFANSSTAIGGGVINGHVYGGLTEGFKYLGFNVSAGDINLPFTLGTDFVENSAQFYAVGVAASRGDKTSKSMMTVFIGATSTMYTTPFFFGAKLDSPTAAFFYTLHFSPVLTFDSAEVISDQQTSIQTLTYHPLAPLTFSAAAGVGSNSPFAAGRVAWKSLHWNGVVNYTKRGTNFERITLPYATFVENNGLNASGTFTSSHFNFSADHTGTLSDLPTGIIQSKVNSVSASGSLSIFGANGSTFFGEAAGRAVAGQTAGLTVRVGPASLQANVYRSATTSQSMIVNMKLSRHYSVNAFIQRDAVNFGGEYHSNLLTVSGGYSMSYFPVLNAFQKVPSAQLTVQLPNALTLSAGTVTTPNGQTKWTASSTKVGQAFFDGHSASVSGKYEYTGDVVDADGNPVAGVAILIGKKGQHEVFTDSKGRFILPTRKKKSERLSIPVSEFMAAGRWRVISAPKTVSPESNVQIVVARIL
jgi:hypothetical protein